MQSVVAEQGRSERGGGHCWHWHSATASSEHRVGRPGETFAMKGERWTEVLAPQTMKIRKAMEKQKVPALPSLLPSQGPIGLTHFSGLMSV